MLKFSLLMLASVLVVTGCGNSPEKRPGTPYVMTKTISGSTLAAKSGSGVLSQDEVQGILKMREEEKLAFDVYFALEQKWGQQVFRNIMASEKTHMSSMLKLLETYGLEDPVKDAARGIFTDSEMQKLYGELVAQGLTSPADAMRVGATIEDMDIADLMRLTASTTNSRVRIVYGNLERGSKNHLRAFVGQLKSFGVTYTPVHISQEIFDSIVR